MNYDVYFGKTAQNRTKTYLVFENGKVNFNQAKKYFRCSLRHLKIVPGFVLNDELFFERPHTKGTKTVAVVFYV